MTDHYPLSTSHWPQATSHWPLTISHWLLMWQIQPNQNSDDMINCSFPCSHLIKYLLFTASSTSFYPLPSIYFRLSTSVYLRQSIYVRPSMSVYLCPSIYFSLSMSVYLLLSIYFYQTISPRLWYQIPAGLPESWIFTHILID